MTLLHFFGFVRKLRMKSFDLHSKTFSCVWRLFLSQVFLSVVQITRVFAACYFYFVPIWEVWLEERNKKALGRRLPFSLFQGASQQALDDPKVQLLGCCPQEFCDNLIKERKQRNKAWTLKLMMILHVSVFLRTSTENLPSQPHLLQHARQWTLKKKYRLDYMENHISYLGTNHGKMSVLGKLVFLSVAFGCTIVSCNKK